MIADTIPNKNNTGLMVSSALSFLEVALFPYKENRSPVKQVAGIFIRHFIGLNENAYAKYAELCQRIFMTRRYIIQHPSYDFNFNMLSWLDPDNAKGFAGTAPWFETLQDRRKQNPLHLLELKAFPEALLELAEERSADIFHYWHSWFKERRAWEQFLMLQQVGVQLAFEPAAVSALDIQEGKDVGSRGR